MSHVKYKKPKRGRPGRKVYRTRKGTSSRKSSANSAVKAVICIIGLAVLVFLGYSIGAPIHKYFSEKKASEDNDISSDTLVTETAPAVTEETTTAEPAAETETLPEETELDIPALSEIKAASVSLDVMNDLDALNDELASIKNEGYNAVVFTLKAEGGDIYFNIKSPFASFARGDNIKSNLFADELASAARDAGLYPIARINLLEDSNIYGESGYGSYKTADGEIWTDTDGNSYLSPYNEDAVDFIDDISSEVSAGGFDYIIISGDRFPEFELSDYDELGEGLAFGDRYNALVRVANIVYDNAAEHGCGVILEVTAKELADRNAEVLHPEALKFDNLSVIYDDEEASDISDETKLMNVIPAYKSEAPDDAENCIVYR